LLTDPLNPDSNLNGAPPADLLSVQDLKVHFITHRTTLRAVDGVSFTVKERETFGLVGESGSGKSVTCRALVRLVHPPGKIVSGSILYSGKDLLALSDREFNLIRGREIAMIFQDPMTALNPVLRIREQITESLKEDGKLDREERINQAIELMKLVGIPAPERRLSEYPHQFSGGMRQRVMIAIALSRNPHLLLADEPTTAIDVTLQDQILKLLLRLQREFGMGMILVTHDLGIVAQTCDRVAVMYAGRIMETASALTLFKNPHHPYTLGLLNSIPKAKTRSQLEPIPGAPPDMIHLPPGCRFHPRCKFASDECRQGNFDLRQIGPDHYSACIKDVR
jgi:oligopeptide/dipeptide ABC transporter ATP-binding protein